MDIVQKAGAAIAWPSQALATEQANAALILLSRSIRRVVYLLLQAKGARQ
jgi:hypothetical protein